MTVIGTNSRMSSGMQDELHRKAMSLSGHLHARYSLKWPLANG